MGIVSAGVARLASPRKPLVGIEVDVQPIVRVGRALVAEGVRGQKLRKDLIVALRAAAQPAVQAVQAKIRAMPSGDTVPHMGPYLASKVKTQVRLTGRSAGVRVRIQRTPALRGFSLAARRLNAKSWRRRVYGKKWVVQQSHVPDFFDGTLRAGKERYRFAVLTVVRRYGRYVGESVSRR